MSSNVRSFNLTVGTYASTAPAEQIGKLHRAVALEALKGVVLMTPVDKGRARGNWQVTLDVPAGGELEVEDKDGGPTISRGSATIAAVKPYSVTWLANNVDYIEELEKGHSQQAPKGILAVTFARLSAWLGRQR